MRTKAQLTRRSDGALMLDGTPVLLIADAIKRHCAQRTLVQTTKRHFNFDKGKPSGLLALLA